MEACGSATDTHTDCHNGCIFNYDRQPDGAVRREDKMNNDKWIFLPYCGRKIPVNMAKVVCMRPEWDGGTYECTVLMFEGGGELMITEKMPVIMEMTGITCNEPPAVEQ